MTLKPLLLWTALNLMGTAAMADEKKCVQVLDADTISIRVWGVGATGNSPFDTTLTLATRELAGTLSKDPDKKLTKRTVEADELAALVAAFKPLCLEPRALKSAEPFSGGGSRFELKQKDGAVRVVAYQGAVADGSTYYPVSNEVGVGLHEAYPRLEGKRAALTPEQELKKFLLEVQFGPPWGPREPAKSYARLDPTKTRYAYFENKWGKDDQGVQVQVTPKDVKLDLAALAHELDVAHPIAFQVNGEHNVWMLGDGDTKKPLGKWRLGEIEVRLTMPTGTRGQGYSGSIKPIDGATVDYVITRVEK